MEEYKVTLLENLVSALQLLTCMDCKHKDNKKSLNYFIVQQEGRQNKTFFFPADIRMIFKIKQ